MLSRPSVAEKVGADQSKPASVAKAGASKTSVTVEGKWAEVSAHAGVLMDKLLYIHVRVLFLLCMYMYMYMCAHVKTTKDLCTCTCTYMHVHVSYCRVLKGIYHLLLKRLQVTKLWDNIYLIN